MTESLDVIARIRALNDALRIFARGGRVMMTAGVAALPDDQRASVVAAVRSFDAFDSDNDPHGEHDCACLVVDFQSIIWKIDYFDPTMSAHSDDPTDPAVTRRVLTIMFSSEY